ncbi:MAG: potassium channel family protein [Pirellulales bacterium]|nr:potassium channel family protein [Pirellulales bacterium]
MERASSAPQAREQYRVLREIEDGLEMPLFVLSLVWAALLIVELGWGAGVAINRAATAIWIAFVVEFALRFVIAPGKLAFLRANWLTLFSLVLPALRVFRIARVARILRAGRAVRGLTLARVVTAFNRGLRSLQRTMGRFGFIYVAMLTILVTLLGAAGMFYFERSASDVRGLDTFGDALWFTGMLMTTSGSDYWPRTAEGRILCFLLAVYAFTVFGYVTAALASLLLKEDRASGPGTARSESMDRLHAEIAALRRELRARSPDRRAGG